MDPNATWTELLEALNRGDWPAARAAAETLLEWLQKGGYSPCLVPYRPAKHPRHRVFTAEVCRLVLQASEKPDATG